MSNSEKNQRYPTPEAFAAQANYNRSKYNTAYRASILNSEEFWKQQAESFDWIKPFTKVKEVSFSKEDLHIRWFYDGKLNVSANCLDRHLKTQGDKIAIIWEADDPKKKARHISYRQLHTMVCRMANILKKP